MQNRKQIYAAESPRQTKKLGGLLAKEILKSGPGKSPRVLALTGDLGAGKTNFIQGFAKGLEIKETISSPTFVIAKIYSLKKSAEFKNFYHIDCYRLKSGDDLALLGAKEIFSDPQNIVAVEWPLIAADSLPKNTIKIGFEIIDAKCRHISMDCSDAKLIMPLLVK